jgi:hypothetical protein
MGQKIGPTRARDPISIWMTRAHKMRVAMLLCAGLGIASPAWAQAPYPAFGPPQQPPAAYPNQDGWRSTSPDPEDAYKDGLITRWQFEQLRGPLPQALQGPSVNGSKGAEPGP